MDIATSVVACVSATLGLAYGLRKAIQAVRDLHATTPRWMPPARPRWSATSPHCWVSSTWATGAAWWCPAHTPKSSSPWPEGAVHATHTAPGKPAGRCGPGRLPPHHRPDPSTSVSPEELDTEADDEAGADSTPEP